MYRQDRDVGHLSLIRKPYLPDFGQNLGFEPLFTAELTRDQ
jgi:hypothetical protein